MKMLVMRNFFSLDRKVPDVPKFGPEPEPFLRSVKRHSMRVKRAFSTVRKDAAKRKSDSFVNSQEWTLSRSVPELRLGIVGSLNSGKSALVHRYLTGSYMQEESPEGGRFKKEVFIDNQSYLLLIRDEGGLPEMQFAAWVDAVIFVFSLENEASFNAIYNFYTRMSHFRNSAEIPIILVGTQDAITDHNPRVVEEIRARKLAGDLKRCSYFETCATYGLNVDSVFQEACQKIVQQRMHAPSQCITPTSSRPTTPQGTRLGVASFQSQTQLPPTPSNGYTNNGVSNSMQLANNFTLPHRHHSLSASSHQIPIRMSGEFVSNEQKHQSQPQQSPIHTFQRSISSHGGSQPQTILSLTNDNNNVSKFVAPIAAMETIQSSNNLTASNNSSAKDAKELPTPSSTPTTARKSRRRSNLFIPSSKKAEEKLKNSELGSGRAIPIKQGYLYKRSSNSLNKEWKKKYVTLCDDGRLTYHSSLHDYMDDSHGKVIQLQCVTVKIPGQKPRGSKSILTNSTLTSSINATNNKGNAAVSDGLANLSLAKDRKVTEKVLLSAFDALREPAGKSNSQTSGDEGIVMSNSNSQTFLAGDNNHSKNESSSSASSNVKKRHRRMKSSGVKNNELDDSEAYEFFIVSLEGKQWHFEAASNDERDEWVTVIEQEIFKSLQSNISSRSKPVTSSDLASMQMIKNRVPGNATCVDCDSSAPEWASLNLGILMCIECSGIHRNLGTHISKVRSLGLDDWTPGYLSVMLAVGNSLLNSVYEATIRNGHVKPTPKSSREEREKWIRAKYEAKEFLPECNRNVPNGQQLVEAVVRSDMKALLFALARCSSEEVNSTVSSRDLRTSLHLACAMGNLAMAQLLILNQANIKQTDHEGRTCLSYAKAAHSLATARLSTGAATLSTSTTSTLSTSSNSDTNSIQPYSFDATSTLVELLTEMGCTDPSPLTASGTLPRRRDTLGPSFEKLPSSVI